MSWRVSRDRRPAAGRGRDGPGQPRQPAPGLHRRDHAVGAHDDGQRRLGRQDRQGPQAGGPSVTGEMDVDPARAWVRGGPAGCSGGVCAADPDQEEAVAAAEICQCGVGPACGQHGGASGQDRVQPDGGGRRRRTPAGWGSGRRSAARRGCRKGSGAAGGAAGRRPSAGAWRWSPWPGRWSRCARPRPGRSGGWRRPGPGRRSSPSRPGRPF
jgi:hypothetical protein